jgi:hypothetical protein
MILPSACHAFLLGKADEALGATEYRSCEPFRKAAKTPAFIIR